jgi:hypothetical protein
MNTTTTTTKFSREKFNFHGGYLTYGAYYSKDEKFIARFKYGFSPITKAKFLKELLASGISVEEYTARLDDGETPVGILDSMNEGWSKRICNAWAERQQSKLSHLNLA